jgi:hypothetical protein
VDNDATLVVKAAGDHRGLYLHFTVTDESFVPPFDDPTHPSWRICDVLSVFLDVKYASEDIPDLSDAVLAKPQAPWGLTVESREFDFSLGTMAADPLMGFSYYDDVFWDWLYRVLARDEFERSLQGSRFVLFEAGNGAKGVELFVPWTSFSWATEGPFSGRRFAFTVGYNDRDANDTDSNYIRWLLYDPLGPAGVTADKQKTTGSWGNLVLE